MGRIERFKKFAADWGSNLTFVDYAWRIGTAATAGVLSLAAAMTPWLAAAGPIGWFLIGLGCTALLAWASVPVSSKIALALRHLGLARATEPQSTLGSGASGKAVAATDSTATIASEPVPSGRHLGQLLHVGQIFMDPSRLREERCLNVSFTLYNGMAEPLVTSIINGAMGYREQTEDGSTGEVAQLPRPFVAHVEGQATEAEPFSEYLVSIHQPVPAALADRMSRYLEGGGTAHFDLSELHVLCGPRDDLSTRCRAPLWDGATLAKRPNSYTCGRIFVMGIEVRASPDVSF